MTWALGKPPESGRARRPAPVGLVLEFVLVFAGTLLAKQVLAATLTTSYPNLLWLPVVLLALAHGLAAGVAAAVIAAAIQYSGGLPPAFMSEDMYAYIARITAEPVGWTCAALLIGHIRSRQIASSVEDQEQLAESRQHCAALAELCDELRQRAETLERQIAANAYASNADLAEAISGLQHAGWDEFVQRLTRFIVLMTGSADFAVHILHGDGLKIAFQPVDAHRPGTEMAVRPEDPLFAAIVDERRIVSTEDEADAALLAGRAIMAGPLVQGKDHVIGMFSICGASLADCPEDIERRFSLTCTELSRLAGRIRLVDRWDASAATGPHGHNGTAEEMGVPAPSAKIEGPPARQRGQPQLTLQ